MKAKLTVTAIAILAGTIAVNAQQQQRRQGPQQGPNTRFGNRPQACPACGSIQTGQRGPNAFRGQRGPQAGPNRQFNQRQQGPRQQQFQRNARQRLRNNGLQQRPQARTPQFAPQQRGQVQQRKQAIMKRFDRDGDGRLSEHERQAIKRHINKRRGGNQADAGNNKKYKQRKPKKQPAEETIE